MKYFYSKEKTSRLVGSLAFDDNDIQEYLNGNPFVDYPDLNDSNTIVSEIRFERPTWTGTEIREMTREEICASGDLSVLVDGEVFEKGVIKVIPIPENLLQPKWISPKWIEGATDLDLAKHSYSEYMRLNNPLDFEDMTANNILADYKAYVKSLQDYITNAKSGTAVISELPKPSQGLENFFNNHFEL